MAEKKKADYTGSAVNLCNPPELTVPLTNLATLKEGEAEIKKLLQETTLHKELMARQEDIKTCEETIRGTIDTYGGFQDLESGTYALKQRRISITYIASKVREFLRTYSGAVIEESVNKRKLEGLRKGGLVTQEDLDRCADKTETFLYIIKVATPRLKAE